MAREVERLKEIMVNTIESDLKYEGSHKSLDYFNLFCKASANQNVNKIYGNNVCMFNYTFESTDAILILFSIPINTEETSGSKNIAERVMEIITLVEKTFTTTDYVQSEEVKEDKFIYITIIKKVGEK